MSRLAFSNSNDAKRSFTGAKSGLIALDFKVARDFTWKAVAATIGALNLETKVGLGAAKA